MTSFPKISIITVVFNGEKFIQSTIESIINQTFKEYEFLVIDGASTDGTMKMISKYKDNISQIISEPDEGVYDAMNKGLQMASGEYVVFINAGDELASPDTLKMIFSKGQNADLIYGETLIIDPNRIVLGTRTELTSRKLPHNLVKNDFLNGQVVSHQSFVPKRTLCEPYYLEYKCSSDIDWMIKIVERSKKIYRSNHPISKYLQGGISDRQLKQCWKERLQILLHHFNSFTVLFKHVQFAFRYLKNGAYRS